jgi:hypothetical protein
MTKEPKGGKLEEGGKLLEEIYSKPFFSHNNTLKLFLPFFAVSRFRV